MVSAKSLIHTLAGTIIASSSITLTGPLRPFFKVSRTSSFSLSDFIACFTELSCPMILSSSVIWSWVRRIEFFTWLSSSVILPYQR